MVKEAINFVVHDPMIDVCTDWIRRMIAEAFEGFL